MKILFGLAVVILLFGCGKEDKNEKILREIKQSLERRQVDLSVSADTKNAKGVKVPEEIKNLCEKFLSKIIKKDYAGAFHLVKRYSGIPKKEFENLENITKSQITMFQPRFGNYIDYEFVKTVRISDSLIKFIYITKMENHALRWIFTFYKPQNKWFLNGLIWDDKIHLMN